MITGNEHRPIQRLLDQALQAHRIGKLDEAESLYRRIIAADSNNFDALHMLGVACSQKKRFTEAAEFYRAAIAIDRNFPPCYHNYGLCLVNLKNYPEALEAFDKALSLAPKHAPIHSDRANVLRELGRLEDALASHNAAIALAPNAALAFYNRGITLFKLKDYKAALRDYDKATLLRADYAEAHCGRGDVLRQLKRYDEAIASYNKALALKPDLAEAWNGSGNASIECERYDEAVASYEKALALKPDYVDARVNLGNALHALCRREEAVRHYEQALALRPGFAEAYLGLGKTLHALNRHDDATLCYEKALALRPDDAEARVLFGNMLSMLERHDEADRCYEHALTLKPHFPAAKWNKGLLCLSLGNFAEGWELYESRWAGIFNEKSRPRYLQPRWDGDFVKGSLLIWGEQGVGDHILFSSMIPELTAHAELVVLETEPRLVSLFARSFPQVRVIEMTNELYTGPIDAHESIAGLGKFLRRDWGAFPKRQRGYLVPDDGLVAKLRGDLAADHRLLVGLSWNSIKPWLHEPIGAPLCDFGALFQLPNCYFVDLQYGDTLAEREMVAQQTGILLQRVENVDNSNDLDALAALISACDVVVTISNTTAHLAGALGKPTWVLVPYSKTRHWHWFRGKEQSPWYPRTRVIRQQRGQAWTDLIALVTREVSAFIREAPHPT